MLLVNDRCQWAFYDHSRSRTGRWCSMRVCGHRVEQARWRTGQAT
ncbi:CGNR zinc finger domain-containing protein [Nonomuraea wenchangensis]